MISVSIDFYDKRTIRFDTMRKFNVHSKTDERFSTAQHLKLKINATRNNNRSAKKSGK